MPRVVHFEIHAADPEWAVNFYKSLFDCEMNKWDGPAEYWLIRTGSGPGIDGGLLRRHGSAPSDRAAVNAFVCTIDVPNVEEFVNKALAAGPAVALPKMPIPGVGWLAYVKDTEGNILGLMQSDPTAN